MQHQRPRAGRARELLRRVGSLAQVGGVQLLRHEEGHARGTRALEFRTGSGLRFTVAARPRVRRRLRRVPGLGLCWLPAKGLAGPVVLRGRPRRLRVAARRARRPLQHGRAGLDGHAADRADRASGSRSAWRRATARTTASPSRPRARFTPRRGPGTAIAACSGPRARCARRSPTARTSCCTRRYEAELGGDVVPITRRRHQRGLVHDAAPAALPLQHRLPAARRRRRGARRRGGRGSRRPVVLDRRGRAGAAQRWRTVTGARRAGSRTRATSCRCGPTPTAASASPSSTARCGPSSAASASTCATTRGSCPSTSPGG